MKKKFIEPEVEVIEFELQEQIARDDVIIDSNGWIIPTDPDKEWQ